MRTGESVLTSEFASPEQVKGETITTASDIYTLGVILYVLLTGRQPYWLETGSFSELSQAICEQVPRKPSEIAAIPGYSPERLKRILGGDLDAIVLMAMRKNRRGDMVRPNNLPTTLSVTSSSCRYALIAPRWPIESSNSCDGTRWQSLSAVYSFGIDRRYRGCGERIDPGPRERDGARESLRGAHQAVNQFFTQVSQRQTSQPARAAFTSRRVAHRHATILCRFPETPQR